MKNRKLRILTYLLALAGILLTAALYPILPEQIPTNWNMDGTVTYGSQPVYDLHHRRYGTSVRCSV